MAHTSYVFTLTFLLLSFLQCARNISLMKSFLRYFYIVFKEQFFLFPQCYLRYGGDEENRTPDPLLARQVLSQLSYTPMCFTTCTLYHETYDMARAIELTFPTFRRPFARLFLFQNKPCLSPSAPRGKPYSFALHTFSVSLPIRRFSFQFLPTA